jgi:hypothetical protein
MLESRRGCASLTATDLQRGKLMDPNERRLIDDLFERLGRAEAQAAARDPDAEALIRRHVAAQPAAPYYMAQAIVVQQEALARAHSRIRDLERQRDERRPGGFLSGLFGEEEPSSAGAATRGDGRRAGLDRYWQSGAGGGFLAGAMQTALGVAGGFLIADAISGLFAADPAAAAAPDATPAAEDQFGNEEPDLAEEVPGDLDFGEF